MALQTYDTKREVVTSSPPSTISKRPGDPVRTAFELAVPIAQGTPSERTLMASPRGLDFPTMHCTCRESRSVEEPKALKRSVNCEGNLPMGPRSSGERLCMKRYL